MAAPNRLHAYTKKTDAPLPAIPVDWLLTIDLDGMARAFLEFPAKWPRRPTEARNQAGLEAWGAHYHLRHEQQPLPAAAFNHAYSAVYRDDALGPACLALLQLGIQARIILSVKAEDRPIASFAIATNRPAQHILAPFFSELALIKPRAFESLQRGRRIEPRYLTRFTLPQLMGVEGAEPVPVPVHEAPPTGIVLGHTVSPLTQAPLGPLRIQAERLTRGTLVAGTTGSGKTNTVHHLIHAAPRPAWILCFDVKKEYRSLHETHGARVYRFSQDNLFTHNLLKPEGPPARWIKEVASILSEVVYRDVPAVGAKDIVIQELDALYRERGIYDGSTDYPHVGHLLERLEARAEDANHREAGWIASAMRVLRSLQVGTTKPAFCVREGLALERIMTGINIIELDDLGDRAAASLLVSVLLQKIHNRMRGEPHRGRRGLIVIEEAQHLLAQGAEATSVLTTTCREIRSTGIGLVLVTQMPSDFSRHALANVNTLVAHRLVHPSNRRAIADMMGLSRNQEQLLAGLPVGRALVLADHLSLVQVPEAPRPHVPDSQVPGLRVPREEVATNFAQRRTVENRVVDLAPREWEVFLAIAEARAIYPSGIKDTLGYSHQEVSRTLRKLISRGLVRYRPGKKGGRGKLRSIHFPTPYGEEAHRARRGRYPDRNAQRSPEHAPMVARVLSVMGIERLPHRRFDILYREGGAERAIEVETGSNNDRQLMENLVKSLDFQGEASFVGFTERVCNRIIQAAARHCYDRRVAVTLHVASLSQLPEWDTYRFEPAAIRA